MADAFDPDAYLKQTTPPPAFDPDAYLGKPTKPKETFLSNLTGMVTDIPGEIYDVAKPAMRTIGATFNPWSEQNIQSIERQKAAAKEGLVPFLKAEHEASSDLGRGMMAVPELVTSPITGTGRSVIGHGLAMAPGATYEDAKEKADLAMMALAPGRGVKTVPVPPRPTPGPLGVTLSEGQETGNLAKIQGEQEAIRNSKVPGHARAQEFAAQQRQQVEQARENVTRGLDPLGGQVIAEGPQEAGALVSQSVQQEAASAKAGVKQAYDAAKAHPGEIHASAFDDIGSTIKTDLSNRSEPVIIDDKLTPYAAKAIEDIEKRVEPLLIQNRASPYPQPQRQNIVGVTLEGVEQMRKRLSTFRRDAFGSGNTTDGRATSAVIDAFDEHIDRAIQNGLFNGDVRAVNAWNDARAAYSDYRKTFTGAKNDPVGKVIDKITGRVNNTAAIPNEVANFLYGASGTKATTLNVGVANRVKGILGVQSPEWIGVKQGLFSRLTETPQGVTDWGPARVGNNINKFLNGGGRELAEAVFSPAERQLLQSYADVTRKMIVPQAGANWSNTSVFQRATDKIGSVLGKIVGAAIGGAAGHVVPVVGEWIGAGAGAATAEGIGKIGQASRVRQIARQMPIVAQQMRQWQKAVAKAQLANTPPSRAAVAFAAGNLSRSLERIGIGPLQSLGISHADENQPDIPGPGGQKKHGGAVGNIPRFAHGGKIKRYHHPVQIGAKRARDGNWYIPDHSRPGKYLRVEHGRRA